MFAQRANGSYGGFVIGWSDWIINTAALASIAIAFAEYVGLFFPALGGAVKPVAIGTLVVLAALNAVGVGAGSGTQQLTSALKALALLVFVAACFGVGSRPLSTTAAVPGGSPSSSLAPLVAAVVGFEDLLEVGAPWSGSTSARDQDYNGELAPRAQMGCNGPKGACRLMRGGLVCQRRDWLPDLSASRTTAYEPLSS